MHKSSRVEFTPRDLAMTFPGDRYVRMLRTREAKRPLRRTFLREWRKFRNLSQEALAEKLGVSHATLSRVERAQSPYNQRYLESAAEALGCGVADLIARSPSDPDPIWMIWDKLSPEERRLALALLQTLKTSGHPP